jgi:hypothetical protein
MLSILFLVSAWAVDCPKDATADDLRSSTDHAMLAFATLDEEGFVAAIARSDEQVACLGMVVPAPVAAAYHRMHALDAMMDGEIPQTQEHLRAALLVEPDYELSASIAPEGGRLARLYTEARNEAAPETTTMDVPRGLTAYVNGKVAKELAPVPAIVQLTDGGTVVHSLFVTDGVLPPVDGADPGSVASGPVVAPAAVTPPPAATPAPAAVSSGFSAPGSSSGFSAPGSSSEFSSPGETSDAGSVEEPDVAELLVPGRLLASDDARVTNTSVATVSEPKPAKMPKPTKASKPAKIPSQDSMGKKKSPAGWWVGAAVTGAAAGGMYAASHLYLKPKFMEDPTEQGFRQTQGAYYASLGAGGVAVGLTTIALVGSF